MGLGTALPSTHFTDVETEAWRAGLSFCLGQSGRQAGRQGPQAVTQFSLCSPCSCLKLTRAPPSCLGAPTTLKSWCQMPTL